MSIKARVFDIIVVALIVFCVASCSSDGDGRTAESAATMESDTLMRTADLDLYELQGNVRRCKKVSYFDVVFSDGNYNIDPKGKNIISVDAEFDSIGVLLPKKGEQITRDDKGRIIRWENNLPTVGDIPVGFLKDTISYKYLDKYHVVSEGMGLYSVVVYDDNHNVTGQYTVPRQDNTHTASFPVYTKFDSIGNWTERINIWSTQGQNDELPSLKYSIDRRSINYY